MAPPPEGIDWQAIGDEALALFIDLLRIDTTNPPGNERPAAERLAEALAEDGIEAEIIESAPRRANLVARLPATHPATGQGPLLFSGHTDVVPAEPERWSQPPFGAVIHKGYVYARGAIDMKNLVAMSAMVLKLYARFDLPRDRDLIFCATADEEEGCTYGAQFMVENHPDKVKADFMLSEIGGFPLDFLGTRFYPIQIAEKGLAWMKLTARSDPGHGSMPFKQAATARLARALAKITAKRLPQHVTPATRRMIQTLASSQKLPLKVAIGGLLKPHLSTLLLSQIKPVGTARSLAALLSNTVSVTQLEAGTKINQIPGEASAYLDGRLLPGQSAADLIAEIQARIGAEREHFQFDILQEKPSVETTPDGALWDSIVRSLRKNDPQGVPLPYIIPGFTDAKYFHKLGTRCFGFSPIRWPVSHDVRFSELFHGIDERANVEGFRWGLTTLFDAVEGFVSP